jgi:hypothetical protein
MILHIVFKKNGETKTVANISAFEYHCASNTLQYTIQFTDEDVVIPLEDIFTFSIFTN